MKRILSPGMKRIVSPYFTEVTKMAEQKEELGEPVKKKPRKAHVKVPGYGDGGVGGMSLKLAEWRLSTEVKEKIGNFVQNKRRRVEIEYRTEVEEWRLSTELRKNGDRLHKKRRRVEIEYRTIQEEW